MQKTKEQPSRRLFQFPREVLSLPRHQQVKRKCGIEVGKNYNLPKNEDSRQPQCPEDKESAIVEVLKHFNIIYSKNSPSSTGGR